MAVGRIFDIVGAIIGVALATVLVTSANTAKVISAFGDTFAGSLRAAMGR